MSARIALLGWASAVSPSRQAAELSSIGGHSLELALPQVAGQLKDARFLVVGVRGVEVTGLSRAIHAFRAAGGNARLCLAGDRATLVAVDQAGFDHNHVGLMLDDVDVDTACSHLIWDRIEAVRFGATFVSRASNDLRVSCALESMLGLARNIGLRTLGFDSTAGGGKVSGRCDFDYLPARVASAISPYPPSARRTRAGATATPLR